MASSSTKVRIVVDGETIDEVTELDYASDMLAVGDQAHFTVPNLGRRYTGSLQEGSLVELSMSNPYVRGPKSSLAHRSPPQGSKSSGDYTLKHRGRIVERVAEGSPTGGSFIKVTAADLGWHLQNCCAPLWFNLRQGNLRDLIDPARSRPGRGGQPLYFLDPSFGLKGVRGSNKINRNLKQSVKTAEAVALQELTLFAIQVEPSDHILDKILEYARRENLLVNVSVDGYLQAWLPDYSEPPQYHIVNRAGQSNILSYRRVDDIRSRYTEVECVGEQFGFEGDTQDPNNPNATKKRGKVKSADLPQHMQSNLPFLHRLTFSDGEMYNRGLAKKMAEWRYKRSLFDSFFVEYIVEEHYQDGVWWEADFMCSVDDEDAGLSGNFYIQSVNCTSRKSEGDLTRVVLRLPGLLTAGLDRYPGRPARKVTRQAAPGVAA